MDPFADGITNISMVGLSCRDLWVKLSSMDCGNGGQLACALPQFFFSLLAIVRFML